MIANLIPETISGQALGVASSLARFGVPKKLLYTTIEKPSTTIFKNFKKFCLAP